MIALLSHNWDVSVIIHNHCYQMIWASSSTNFPFRTAWHGNTVGIENISTSPWFWGVWKSHNSEPGSRKRNRNRNWNWNWNWNRNWNRNFNWDWGKLGSTETCSWYPCGNNIQGGILCYHCFEKFSAQWSWYQRYAHIPKETCKKKERNH